MAGYQVQHIFRLIFQQKLSPKMKSHSMNQTEKSYAIIYTVSQRRQPHRLKFLSFLILEKFSSAEKMILLSCEKAL